MVTEHTMDEPSPLFAQMLREQPGRALAWLRAADYMPDDEERRYCLKQALLIDPTDKTAQARLLALDQSHVEPERPLLSKGWLALGHLLQAILPTAILYRSTQQDPAH